MNNSAENGTSQELCSIRMKCFEIKMKCLVESFALLEFFIEQTNYSGSNNYLICRFTHLQRMELCIILINGTF